MRQRVLFNDGWTFFLGDCALGDRAPCFAEMNLDDAAFTSCALPHDWSVDYPIRQDAPSGGGGGYAISGVGWYRKRFAVPEAADRRVILQFDGVFMNSTVYLNGVKVGGRAYGYIEFTIDLTALLVPGENVLAVRVDNSMQPNSRWYTGSGIYRNVWLILCEPVHIAQNGVFIATNGVYNKQTEARVQIQAAVENDSSEDAVLGIEYCLLDAEGNEAARDASALCVRAGARAQAMVCPTVKNPRLWSDSDPYLYTLETIITKDGKQLDRVLTRMGIRTADFDCDRGFLLNGTPVKIKGMCVHHDGGLTGAAFYRETWERRLTLLKDMGCNGIRCAHNPPAPELLDLCDELGFLVMDEAFDEWLLTKFKSAEYGYASNFAYGYGQFFTEYAETDLVTMIRRDRNHPSIIIWSVGNEIPEQSAVEGVRILNFLRDLCYREDSTRLVTSAMDNLAAPEQFCTREEFECALDVAGYNYVARWGIRAETLYDEDRRKFPKRRFIGTENPSAGGVRGTYETQRNDETQGTCETRLEGPGSRYRYDRVTLDHEFLWRYTASRDFVAGDYLWTGIDYLGESRWPLRGAVSGAIDTAGFPKDTFYYFRSIWNKRDTTLHICPHWNWPGREGEFITVIGYTDCDEVSLYLNGRLVGTKGYDFPNVGALGAWNIRAKNTNPTTHDLHLAWDVPYEAGELRAVGYKNGAAVAEQVVRTTGAPFRLAAACDRELLTVNGIAHIEIEALDAGGLAVPTADILVRVRVEGCAALLGMDNGNLQDHTLYSNPERRLFAGRLLCVIRGIAGAGDVARVILSAEGMEELVVNVTL
jgi:beta-galactosidase